MSSGALPVVVTVDRSRRGIWASTALMGVLAVATIGSGDVSGQVMGSLYLVACGWVAWRTKHAYAVRVSEESIEIVTILRANIFPVESLAGAHTVSHHIMGRRMVVLELSLADGSTRRFETINQLPKLDVGPASIAAGWISLAITGRAQPSA